MKKVFLSFIASLFIVIVAVVLWAGTAYAPPPFPVPPTGGFPACQADLNTCTGNLSTCTGDLGTCEGNLATSDGFVDNGDGTVTDVRSGLMWEIKDHSGGVHDVDNTYDWSFTGIEADGTLFKEFLDTLNNKCDGDETISCANDGDCTDIGNGLCGHAGYQDWRIPEVGRDFGSFELEAIVSFTQEFCGDGSSACISPVFGPTVASHYWSATTAFFSAGFAWVVSFDSGSVGEGIKIDGRFARAVRP